MEGLLVTLVSFFTFKSYRMTQLSILNPYSLGHNTETPVSDVTVLVFVCSSLCVFHVLQVDSNTTCILCWDQAEDKSESRG